MNKLATFCSVLICLMATIDLTAQIYVSPNSYVFVKDRLVFAKQDVNIQNNGNFYLRNESQLLQGTTSISTNTGAGKLSVFQEGSVNNFAYNYWCSPVGNASAAVGNENFGATMLNRPTTVTASTPATMLGPGVYDGTASPLAIADRWVFKYLSSTTYAQWIPVGSATTIAAGEGFTMKGTSGTDGAYTENAQTNNPGSKQRYDFRGKPNDGNITISVGPGSRTLTGNPYPSAIDLKAFLVAATNTTQIAYFWEQDPTTNSHLLAAYKGGYGTYSPMATGGPTDPTYGYMGVYLPPTFYAYDGAGTPLGSSTGTGTSYAHQRRFCPIGQGFMIEGTTGGTVTMSNIYRVYLKEGVYSTFNRNENNQDTGFLPEIPSVSGYDYTTVSTDAVPQIRFNTLLNNEGVKPTALAFVDGASDGAQPGMDARSPDELAIDMYFVIDDSKYVISAVDFDINKKIPVGFKNDIPASFKVAVAEMINFDTENVYLHDKLNGIYYDIKNTPQELFLQPGVNNTQYEITFVNEVLGVNENNAANSFDVFQNNTLQMLTVANPKRMGIKSVALYDVAGRLIFNKPRLGSDSSYQFPTIGISDAIYIVKIVTTDNQDFAKKITVYNSDGK